MGHEVMAELVEVGKEAEGGRPRGCAVHHLLRRLWAVQTRQLLALRAQVIATRNVITHPVPLQDGPGMYKTVRDTADGCGKVALKPGEAGAGRGRTGSSGLEVSIPDC